ncbi:NAD(P)-dependent oxidoreductase [Streptomyces sp. NPDC005955]|uniref:2-hydroxyacid dehydrogenase n=1 Tax=Streptomyces sp. NPDC005955 TaxID=3364738 RepID=UPI0036BB8EC5
MTGDVWLPVPPDEIEGLPDALSYYFYDGGEDGGQAYPADPADCAFFTVPYLKQPSVKVGALPLMHRLEVIQTLTAGVDDVLPALPSVRSGVHLCNARGVHDASTAELTLALILASLRGVPDFVRDQDRGRWRSGFRPALADRSVLIVGYGSIGAAIEERLLPFEVAAVTRVARSARIAARGPVHALDATPALLPHADVVVLATPLTDETRHLADAAFLARMKDGALLVNVARGAVVDTGALLAELTRGRLTAALDVTDPEPLPEDHPLWHAPGVLISPHVGGPSSAYLPRARRLLVAQLTRYAAGEPLLNPVLVTG